MRQGQPEPAMGFKVHGQPAMGFKIYYMIQKLMISSQWLNMEKHSMYQCPICDSTCDSINGTESFPQNKIKKIKSQKESHKKKIKK